MLIAGLDEAGRGSVIGNLVIVGIVFKEEELSKLSNMGIKDSKKLSTRMREKFSLILSEMCQTLKIIHITPAEIDNVLMRKDMNLNDLEISKMGSIINDLKPDQVYVDAVSPNLDCFLNSLRTYISQEEIKIFAKHKADEIYPIVSAASIIAKVQRDRNIEELKSKFGLSELGSGYPSDPKTRKILIKWLKEGELPSFVRKKWKTIEHLKQSKITTWI